jgi:8-oxo-dGTP pyrophosphatase MutT (NUDIX family)
MSGPAPVRRVGGRLLLIDPDGRVLLIHERIEHGRTHWLTPGGGLEAGEQPGDAAVREVYEETGLRVQLPPSAQPVLIARRRWSWAGVSYNQVDHYFVARVASGSPIEPRALTAMETETLLGHRWWTVDALRASTETIVPIQLADLLERAVSGRVLGA